NCTAGGPMPPPIPSSSDATPKSDAPLTPAPGPAGTDPGSPQTLPLAADYAAILEPPQLPDELRRLGDYRIRRLIGAGGMGFVFEAEEPMPKRDVAIKVMRPELAAQPEARERFLREANAAAALNTDHVVTILRVGTVRAKERELLFLVMPLMRGE